VIRGANVITGYENNPEANASSFTNGWFHTATRVISTRTATCC
jgi:long-subunit acyl-CoA synthetase (AMP-forming)